MVLTSLNNQTNNSILPIVPPKVNSGLIQPQRLPMQSVGCQLLFLVYYLFYRAYRFLQDDNNRAQYAYKLKLVVIKAKANRFESQLTLPNRSEVEYEYRFSGQTKNQSTWLSAEYFFSLTTLSLFYTRLCRAVSTRHKIAKRNGSSCDYCADYFLLSNAYSKFLFLLLTARVI